LVTKLILELFSSDLKQNTTLSPVLCKKCQVFYPEMSDLPIVTEKRHADAINNGFHILEKLIFLCESINRRSFPLMFQSGTNTSIASYAPFCLFSSPKMLWDVAPLQRFCVTGNRTHSDATIHTQLYALFFTHFNLLCLPVCKL